MDQEFLEACRARALENTSQAGGFAIAFAIMQAVGMVAEENARMDTWRAEQEAILAASKAEREAGGA